MTADGLVFNKYDVRRTDGQDRWGEKHLGCNYWVLDLTHDPAALPAVLAYADAVEATHPQLAADIRQRYGPQDSSTIPSEGP